MARHGTGMSYERISEADRSYREASAVWGRTVVGEGVRLGGSMVTVEALNLDDCCAVCGFRDRGLGRLEGKVGDNVAAFVFENGMLRCGDV